MNTQPCIRGERAASVKGSPVSLLTALRWHYWFNLMIRTLCLAQRKTQPKLQNELSHAALLTLHSSTDATAPGTDISSG